MTLNPRFKGQRLFPTDLQEATAAIHTVDIYLDYACPFSKKLYDTVYDRLIPALVGRSKATPFQIIFRQQIQPWHPASALMHEAAVAVLRLSPDKFGEYSKVLFAKQKEYFDEAVVCETRNQTYRRLASLAGKVDGLDPDSLYEMLAIPDKKEATEATNVGNKVTSDIKVLVKTNRLVGVHVTPTVLLDGVVIPKIDSSFTAEQFLEWFSQVEDSS